MGILNFPSGPCTEINAAVVEIVHAGGNFKTLDPMCDDMIVCNLTSVKGNCIYKKYLLRLLSVE